jgi:predicted ribosome quality control (RQC) complex YloA/Tae2 family protein
LEIAEFPPIRRNLKRPPAEQKKTPPVSHLPRTAAGKAGKGELPSRLRPKRYRTEDGLEIWVGRNDEGNDYLTTRLARGNDMFFHLEGYPGSHVVLRTEGKTDPPTKSVLDACELAVHFSKMKNAGSADVHAAQIKDVKKPKGAKAGLVYVRGGKSIRLKRIPERLEKILASRMEREDF